MRLQEELVIKEEALRDTQIRSTHERAQELRVDEFSAQKLRENHETIQRLLNSANPAFREAPDREHSPTNDEYRVDANVPNRLTEHKKLSIYNWNPGP